MKQLIEPGSEFTVDFRGYAGKTFRVTGTRAAADSTGFGRYIDAVWTGEPGDPDRPFSTWCFTDKGLEFYEKRGELSILDAPNSDERMLAL